MATKAEKPSTPKPAGRRGRRHESAVEAGAGADGPDEPEATPLRMEQILSDLESVVQELEQGKLPLEQAIERFEAGVRLARLGTAVLDSVEERVEVLLNERGDTAPFAEASDESDPYDDD